MSYEMNDLLDLMVDQNASDLHLQVGQPPSLGTVHSSGEPVASLTKAIARPFSIAEEAVLPVLV